MILLHEFVILFLMNWTEIEISFVISSISIRDSIPHEKHLSDYPDPPFIGGM